MSNGTNPLPSGESQLPSSLATGNVPQTLGTLLSTSSLGSFNAERATPESSLMAAIFASSRHDTVGSTTQSGQVTTAFALGMAHDNGARFDSSQGSFPSFSKDPALGPWLAFSPVFICLL